ncbi:tail fiber assembly protein [Caballeronia sp. LZ029]|uniref:tail fiber assembly protein n=1 Tax=Caballeronia sp. LZ029 TaxID=3038564 RepID=UPI002858AE40|nr:tail fiber assembly protein [Caballeronia sp. LZ029]MDR5742502.1 tail fiber assembly protein [Caballeronia sp. LZ029]
MKTFARIEADRLGEIIAPAIYDVEIVDEDGKVVHNAGDEIAIEDRFTLEFVATLVDVSNLSPLPVLGMVYDGATFSEYVGPALSPEQVVADNTARRDALLVAASAAIAPLQDAVDLEIATDAEAALLKLWKQYRVAVNRIDLTQSNPVWPAAPAQ